jgi:RNA polymerase sigma factor (sigma-70 family)
MRCTRGEIDVKEEVEETRRDKPALAEIENLLALILPGIFSWAHARLPRRARRRADTGDLVQEAALGAIQHLSPEDLSRPAAISGYIRQSIRNRIIDEIRRSGKVEVAAGGSSELARDSGPSPLDGVLETEDRRRFRTALARLEEDEQILVVGRVDLELSYQELAHATGRPTADAARAATRRAVLKIAREVGRAAPPAGGEAG